MDANEIEKLLDERFEGEMSEERLEALERALSEAPELRREIEAHETIERMLGEMKAPPAPASLRAAVMERVRAEALPLPKPSAFEQLRDLFAPWQVRVLAAACVLGVVAVGVLMNVSLDPESPKGFLRVASAPKPTPGLESESPTVESGADRPTALPTSTELGIVEQQQEDAAKAEDAATAQRTQLLGAPTEMAQAAGPGAETSPSDVEGAEPPVQEASVEVAQASPPPESSPESAAPEPSATPSPTDFFRKPQAQGLTDDATAPAPEARRPVLNAQEIALPGPKITPRPEPGTQLADRVSPTPALPTVAPTPSPAARTLASAQPPQAEAPEQEIARASEPQKTPEVEAAKGAPLAFSQTLEAAAEPASEPRIATPPREIAMVARDDKDAESPAQERAIRAKTPAQETPAIPATALRPDAAQEKAPSNAPSALRDSAAVERSVQPGAASERDPNAGWEMKQRPASVAQATPRPLRKSDPLRRGVPQPEPTSSKRRERYNLDATASPRVEPSRAASRSVAQVEEPRTRNLTEPRERPAPSATRSRASAAPTSPNVPERGKTTDARSPSIASDVNSEFKTRSEENLSIAARQALRPEATASAQAPSLQKIAPTPAPRVAQKPAPASPTAVVDIFPVVANASPAAEGGVSRLARIFQPGQSKERSPARSSLRSNDSHSDARPSAAPAVNAPTLGVLEARLRQLGVATQRIAPSRQGAVPTALVCKAPVGRDLEWVLRSLKQHKDLRVEGYETARHAPPAPGNVSAAGSKATPLVFTLNFHDPSGR